jgi:hypothetical protein
MIAPAFIALSLVTAGLVAYTSRSLRVTIAIVVWATVTALLAATGLLRDFSKLPPVAPILFASGFIMTVLLARSSKAKAWLRLSPAFLVGFQSFRILVELLIHAAVVQGIAPPQMTWTGMNFDIITGVTALVVAPLASRLQPSVLWLWNAMGLALLVWVVGVATLSFPTQFQVLKPDNTWIAEFPFVWLPSLLVTSALLMHVILFRQLSREANRR